MVMATLTPQFIGREFVRQYYTMLHKDPKQMHRFYMKHSLFTHGSVQNYRPIDPIIGQEAIHSKIMQLGYSGCYSKIRSVDSQKTINGGVVVQVIGELSNRGMPMRKFTQTFVLEAESPKNYYVYNDIFRYQDEELETDEQADENAGELYSADEEEIKDEQISNDYDQQIANTMEAVVAEKTAEEIPSYEDEQSIPASLTNGNNLVEEEESVNMNEPAYIPVAEVKEIEEPTEEEPEEEFKEVAVEEEKEEHVAPEPEEEEIKPPEPVEPEGPSKPVTWAAFVKKSTPTTPPQSNAPAPRTTAAKQVSPQPAPIIRPQQPRRREELPKRDNRDEGRKRFSGIAPDSHQIFIGNLPSNISETDVRNIFKDYGTIIEVRLNAKNFGFVAFDAPEPADKILKSEKPIMFGKSAINVEEKRASGGGSRGGPRREFGRVRNDSGSRSAPIGRQGPPQGSRDRPRGGPPGQQKPRGGMNGGEGRGENSRGPRNRDRGAPVGNKR